METQIKMIRSSVTDGTAITPRFREKQLASLHKTLLSARNEIVQAIVDELSCHVNEATAQFLLVMQAVKTFHNAVNPTTLIEEEYQIAKGKNHLSKRTPYGCAYITPSTNDVFYSVVVPVSAAIAAGNCVVLELSQNLSTLNSILRRLLQTALLRETFAIVSSDPFDSSFVTRHCIHLDGRETEKAVSETRYLRTPANRVIAIVDRSAEIAQAAKECVKARFAFGGRSAYAPDVILVNEFAIQKFRTAVAECALRYFAVDRNENGSKTETSARRRAGPLNSELQKKLDNSSAEVLVSGDKGTIAVVRDRQSDLFQGRLNSPLLLITPISSMDDAINFLEDKADPVLRASYLFSAPAAAKYLEQFVASSLTCSNSIPVELLIGPATPEGSTTSLQPRYSPEMFSFASPALIETSGYSQTLSILSSSESDAKDVKKAEDGIDISLKRVAEAFGPPVGFFEQGLLFGLSCVLVSIIGASAYGVRYGYPMLMSRFRGS